MGIKIISFSEKHIEADATHQTRLQSCRSMRTNWFSRCTLTNIQAYYPSFSYLLSDEIHDRKGKKRPFTEQELWYLMFSLSKAGHQNQSVLGPLGSLSPNNVFLNEEGSIKVSNSISWPGPNSREDKELGEAQPYLSP